MASDAEVEVRLPKTSPGSVSLAVDRPWRAVMGSVCPHRLGAALWRRDRELYQSAGPCVPGALVEGGEQGSAVPEACWAEGVSSSAGSWALIREA